MAGIDAQTGKLIDGFDHVEQSIEKLMTTGVGERLMREWVGNPGTRLLGENANERTVLVWFTTIWALIELFEPRFTITQFVVNDIERVGIADFTMNGQHRPYAHLDFEQAALLVSIDGDTVRVQAAT